ncbi:MAG: YeeE/YedE family protein [Gemmatimonadota bacterium]|nr:YeeE/YedE family protein [Gemmatimonadota bacterium]
MSRGPRPYADPYLTGVALGLVLLAAFVLVGRGLGASGAFASVAAGAVNAVSPAVAQRSSFFADRLVDGHAGLLGDWLVVEIAGVFVGGWASAVLARRFRLTIERGTNVSVMHRLGLATIGGSFMGVGAVLARGCTSGQALTGGALLSVGSWIFIAGAFAAAYAAAWLMRGEWT